jgi:peptidoglycan-associated lipoprotein
MTNRQVKSCVRLAALASVLIMTAACNKKVATAPPPPTPPPAPPAPTATLEADPNTIQQGQTVTLKWQTTDATDISIAGLGTLSSSGVKTITPDSSTTYTLIARGPGGSTDSSVRITVNPIPQAAATEPALSDDELFSRNVKDVFFNYDESKIRSEDQSVVSQDASFLSQHSNIRVVLEGHCDDRGSTEYNLALGESRADSMKTALVSQGIGADRLKTVSYGKERPFCNEDNEQCWSQNRRDHVTLQR